MTKTILGQHKSGANITRVILSNERLSVDILTLGSILERVTLDGGPNMTAPPQDLFDRPGDAALIGPLVAPVVNRLTLPLIFDGRDLPLHPVHPEGFVIHSGDGSTHDRIWKIGAVSETEVTLSIDLADGLGGFPGNRTVWATWRLDETDLRLDIEAVTDAPTLMNIAHHPYWALDGHEAGREGHLLQSPAERYTPTTDVALPTGDIKPVEGSDFDFRNATAPLPTLDANLCLQTPEDAEPQHAATLTSAGGRRLDILTTAVGLQVFTGKPYGIALEPQLWPNAPAHPEFPSIRLEPTETFRQTTIYRFSSA